MTTIVFASSFNVDPHEWIEPLQSAIPDAKIVNWSDDTGSVGADLAITWKPPGDLFTREPRIRAVFNLGAGVDALLRLPGLGADVPVVRLEDAGMAVQMAEYAVHALVRASRNFADYEKLQAQRNWKPLPDIQRKTWTVGVLGMGVMGTRVAQTLAALDYPVAGWSRSGKQLPGVQSFAGMQALPQFLARTRVLINTLPLTPETQSLLNRATLGQLVPGAYLVNMGRGEHLVEDDLIPLLDSGQLAGATLDVFRQEPLPKDHPFWGDPRITVTPHVAASSLREETIEQVSDKINRFLRGEPLTGVVPRDRGY
jgi:glyoxylate/hydroxypyruvate reductase A